VSVDQQLVVSGLTPAAIDAIAERVADLLFARLRPDLNPIGRLVDAAELAEILNVRRDWVYEHANELGAKRLTDGSKATIRFDPRHTLQLIDERSRRSSMPEPATPRPAASRRRGRRAAARPPLPIRPDRA
jgi:hypothetical protein